MLPAGIYLLYKHKQRQQKAEEATSEEQTELSPEPAAAEQAIEQQRPAQAEAAMPPPERQTVSLERMRHLQSCRGRSHWAHASGR